MRVKTDMIIPFMFLQKCFKKMSIQKPTSILHKKVFINNKFVDAVGGKTFQVIDPATEEEVCRVAEGGKADVDKAVAAASKAFSLGSEWRMMDASKRGQLLLKLADLIERDLQHLAAIETLENGKPVAFA